MDSGCRESKFENKTRKGKTHRGVHGLCTRPCTKTVWEYTATSTAVYVEKFLEIRVQRSTRPVDTAVYFTRVWVHGQEHGRVSGHFLGKCVPRGTRFRYTLVYSNRVSSPVRESSFSLKIKSPEPYMCYIPIE